MRAIAEAWRHFDRHIVPPDADAAERFEIRRGFYGGMHCLLVLLNGIADLPEAQRTEAMNDMKAELQVFVATMGTRIEGLV